MNAEAPRIRPGSRAEIGLLNHGIARAAGLATGGAPPNLFTTLGRHRALFRRWLRFGSTLMPGGKLPRDETELLILRVAHNARCEYEWRHHERIAQHSGLGADEVERVRLGPEADGWSPRRAALLRAADELHAEREISDEAWAELRPLLTDEQLIEVCMLVGHYEMLAGTLNSLRIEPDELPAARPTRAMRLLQTIADRRRAPNPSR
jgi:alkylhydroperoxidase family enzyme